MTRALPMNDTGAGLTFLLTPDCWMCRSGEGWLAWDGAAWLPRHDDGAVRVEPGERLGVTGVERGGDDGVEHQRHERDRCVAGPPAACPHSRIPSRSAAARTGLRSIIASSPCAFTMSICRPLAEGEMATDTSRMPVTRSPVWRVAGRLSSMSVFQRRSSSRV